MAEEKQNKVAALHQFSKDVMQVWSKSEQIRGVFAPTLTDIEFKFFCGLGISLGANPFKREIWAVKYAQDQPAAVFTGRDFARRKMQEQEDYDGHLAEAVYSNDKYSVKNGIPDHQFDLKDRGELIGAYFVGHRKSIKRPFYHYVRHEEYIQWIKDKKTGELRPNKFWGTKPETMIKKVVEAQGSRIMFQGVFAGTYDESEMFNDDIQDAEVLEPITMPKPKNDTPKEEAAQPPPETEPEKLSHDPETMGDGHVTQQEIKKLRETLSAHIKSTEVGEFAKQYGVPTLSTTEITKEIYQEMVLDLEAGDPWARSSKQTVIGV